MVCQDILPVYLAEYEKMMRKMELYAGIMLLIVYCMDAKDRRMKLFRISAVNGFFSSYEKSDGR
ncbi:MAG: hypothetical protein K2K20_05970 [Lachnospiraceae bacterium]|nr:hypothetical protein [Lachnospiraceae bacterium]